MNYQLSNEKKPASSGRIKAVRKGVFDAEQTPRIGYGCSRDVVPGLIAQFRHAAQHLGEPRRFIALAAVGGAGLVRSVGFQQQTIDRHLRHQAAQPPRTLVSDRAADADQEPHLPQSFRLFLAAGKAMHHSAQRAMLAGEFLQFQDHLLERVARVQYQRQVEIARQP